MTRKQYIRRLNELIIAIHRDADGKQVDGSPWKLGASMKYTRDHVKEVPEKCGSYQQAWDNLKSVRELYGVK